MLHAMTSETNLMVETQPDRHPPGAETMPFCDWLDARMRSTRISQRQLAMRAGVHHSTISRLVRQRRTPSFSTAVRLARVLDPTGITPIARPADPRTASPPMRVEYALRADPHLAASDVRELMRGYLRLRARRRTSSVLSEAPPTTLRRIQAGPR